MARQWHREPRGRVVLPWVNDGMWPVRSDWKWHLDPVLQEIVAREVAVYEPDGLILECHLEYG